MILKTLSAYTMHNSASRSYWAREVIEVEVIDAEVIEAVVIEGGSYRGRRLLREEVIEGGGYRGRKLLREEFIEVEFIEGGSY